MQNIPCPTFADIRLTVRALATVNISKNNIRLSGAKAMAAALQESQITELNISENQLTWNDNGRGYSVDGVVALGDSIKNNGALETLLMGVNRIYGANAGKALGDALAANTVLKELDKKLDGKDDEKGEVVFVDSHFGCRLRKLVER